MKNRPSGIERNQTRSQKGQKTLKNTDFRTPKNQKLPPFLAGADKAKNLDFEDFPSGDKAPRRHPLKSVFPDFFIEILNF